MDAFEDFSDTDIDTDDDWDDRRIEQEASSSANNRIKSFFKKSAKNYVSLTNGPAGSSQSPDANNSSNNASSTNVYNTTSGSHIDNQNPQQTVTPVFNIDHQNDTISHHSLDPNVSSSSIRDASSSSSHLLAPESSSSSSATLDTNNENARRESFFSRGIFSGWRSRQSRPNLASLNQNDGVFNNMNAKPDTEDNLDSDMPPSYEEAAADATPLYWETTIMDPGYSDEIFIDGLPVGSPINFIWNMMVSAAFQFLGFLVTYLLHTSHAAKQGARAGLGFTLFQYGFYLQPSFSSSVTSPGNAKEFQPSNPNDYNVGSNHDKLAGTFLQSAPTDPASTASSTTPLAPGTNAASGWISIVLMTLGFLIIVKSIFDYVRARKMEMVVTQSPSNVPIEQEEAEEMV